MGQINIRPASVSLGNLQAFRSLDVSSLAQDKTAAALAQAGRDISNGVINGMRGMGAILDVMDRNDHLEADKAANEYQSVFRELAESTGTDGRNVGYMVKASQNDKDAKAIQTAWVDTDSQARSISGYEKLSKRQRELFDVKTRGFTDNMRYRGEQIAYKRLETSSIQQSKLRLEEMANACISAPTKENLSAMEAQYWESARAQHLPKEVADMAWKNYKGMLFGKAIESKMATFSSQEEYNELYDVVSGLALRGRVSDKRADGTESGRGHGKHLTLSDGRIVTEHTFETEILGKVREIPSLVPGLTDDQRKRLKESIEAKPQQAIPEDIAKKAMEWATKQIEKGESPFAKEAKDIFGPLAGFADDLTPAQIKDAAGAVMVEASRFAKMRDERFAQTASEITNAVYERDPSATYNALIVKRDELRTNGMPERYITRVNNAIETRRQLEIAQQLDSVVAETPAEWAAATKAFNALPAHISSDPVAKAKFAQMKRIGIEGFHKMQAEIGKANLAMLVNGTSAVMYSVNDRIDMVREMQGRGECSFEQAQEAIKQINIQSDAAIVQDVQRMSGLFVDVFGAKFDVPAAWGDMFMSPSGGKVTQTSIRNAIKANYDGDMDTDAIRNINEVSRQTAEAYNAYSDMVRENPSWGPESKKKAFYEVMTPIIERLNDSALDMDMTQYQEFLSAINHASMLSNFLKGDSDKGRGRDVQYWSRKPIKTDGRKLEDTKPEGEPFVDKTPRMNPNYRGN